MRAVLPYRDGADMDEKVNALLEASAPTGTD